jgi:hypothetical protein
MSDELRRLLDDSLDARIAQMLDAGTHDQPPARSVQRAALALGVGAATATLGASSAAASAAATKAGGAASGSLAAVIAKWFLAGALLGGAASAPLISRSNTEPPRQPAVAPVAVLPSSTPRLVTLPAATAAPEEARPEPEPAQRHVPTTPVSTEAPPPGASVAAFGALPESTLAAETARLDSARHALKSGNAAGALGTLDLYERDFPKRSLAAEATLLRVRALSALGRSTEARAIATRVLSSSGRDGYACSLASSAGLDATGCPGARR